MPLMNVSDERIILISYLTSCPLNDDKYRWVRYQDVVPLKIFIVDLKQHENLA